MLVGGKQRSFSSNWYKKYSWLEYSKQQDAGYCYPCRLFTTTTDGRLHDTFITSGFRNWKHATGKTGILTQHDKCSAHLGAMEAWSQYKLNAKHHTSIGERIEAGRSQVISNNRHYLKTIIEVILMCAKQEIGFRGHRESTDAPNRGNFLEILTLVAAHDPVVKRKLTDGPRNAVYTSAEIQNVLLHIMGEMVREKICTEVREAGVYSILVDETKDISKIEQVAIVVRYVKEGVIYERFLTFVEASKLDAKALSTYIIDVLNKYQLDLQGIVSQGYDGASVMGGRHTGVQQRIMEIVPQAVYIHCFAHVLNLVLVDCSKNVSCAANFFALLQALYVFISSSKAHTLFIKNQNELHPTEPKLELKRLSDTRWACRYMAVDTISRRFDVVLATLEDVADSDDHNKAIEARGLLLQIQSFCFILTLIIFDRVLSCTKMLSDLLQSQLCDLARATDLVSATIETIEEYRLDSSWEHLYSYAQDVAKLHNIPISSLPQRRRTRAPSRLDQSVIFETTGVRATLSTSADYKINLYCPILDSILNELKKRFASKNLGIMKSIQACSPQASNFLDPNSLKSLSDNYSINYTSLEKEAMLAKRTLTGKYIKLESISDVLLELLPLREAFPTLVKLLQIALTISVSSSQCERCFSALKRIKSYLRSTMTEERLVDIASLSIEHDISSSLSFEMIVDKFASSDRSRRVTQS